MSEEEKKEKSNVVHIDKARIKSLEKKNYWKLYEEFDMLRLKLIYENGLTQEDGTRFVTLLRFMMKNGHSESMKYMARKLYEKYVLGVGEK